MKNTFKKLMVIALTLIGISNQIEAGFFSRRYYAYEPVAFYAAPRAYYSYPQRAYYYDSCSYGACRRCNGC